LALRSTSSPEKVFLATLRNELIARGEDAVIFANFFPPNSPHQVDFFVATSKRGPYRTKELRRLGSRGGRNGPWRIRTENGSPRQLDAKNPYRQALGCTFAISDAMRKLAASDTTLPRHPEKKSYAFFESFVCIFPTLHSDSVKDGTILSAKGSIVAETPAASLQFPYAQSPTPNNQ
jgi:hypothetical protein